MKTTMQLTQNLPAITSSFLGSSWRRLFLVALPLVYLSVSNIARATCNEGCGSNSTTSLGEDALSYGTGFGNTAVGYHAENSGSGSLNTAVGLATLYSNNGVSNTAIGNSALLSNTSGGYNTAVGDSALFANLGDYNNWYNGSLNTAVGAFALYSNTSGSENVASGEASLYANTTGYNNTACGYGALGASTTGISNTACGWGALAANTTGSNNTAVGQDALGLSIQSSGNANTVTGVETLSANTTGSNNTANGFEALSHSSTGSYNTAIGNNALLNNTTGGTNIALGDSAGSLLTSGSNNIDIGNAGVAAEAAKIRIGTKGKQTATFIAGISGVTVASGIPVIVNTSGQLGTTTSSGRYKEHIQPMDKASEAILSLQPVTFRYKHDLDPAGIPQFGLVAEQVEKINRDLVVRDDSGKPYSVRYDAVNAMLLNEFLKEHRKVESLEKKLAQQHSDFSSAIAQEQEQIKALTTRLQTVSDEVQLERSPARVVANQGR